MARWKKFKKMILELIGDLESIGLRIAVFLLFCYGIWRVFN